MSAFAWWEWASLGAGFLLSWLIGYSSGVQCGRLEGHRRASECILKTLEEIADKQNAGATKLNKVCEMFRQTVLLLDKIGKRFGGDN